MLNACHNQVFLRDREGEGANRRGDQSLRLCQSTTLSNREKVEGSHRYNCMVDYIYEDCRDAENTLETI